MEGDVSELKTEAKITGFKIYRIEKSLDDMKAVLEKLTDVYHNQSMIQKDVIAIYKELTDVRVEFDTVKRSAVPIHDSVAEHMTKVNTTGKLTIVALGFLYAIAAWMITQAVDYSKTQSYRVSELELTSNRRSEILIGNREKIDDMVFDINTLNRRYEELREAVPRKK